MKVFGSSVEKILEIEGGGYLGSRHHGEPQAKIAALETQIQEMKQHLVSVMNSSALNGTPSLPPAPSSSSSTSNPPSALRPPVRFSQRE